MHRYRFCIPYNVFCWDYSARCTPRSPDSFDHHNTRPAIETVRPTHRWCCMPPTGARMSTGTAEQVDTKVSYRTSNLKSIEVRLFRCNINAWLNKSECYMQVLNTTGLKANIIYVINVSIYNEILLISHEYKYKFS